MSWSEYFQDFFQQGENEASNECGYFQHEENENEYFQYEENESRYFQHEENEGEYFQNEENEIKNESNYFSQNNLEFETDMIKHNNTFRKCFILTNAKPVRHAYINQFPKMFHPYIYKVRDVRADGNYGFRAVAIGLNLHENAKPTVRYHLMEELHIYYNQYVVIFGTKECDDVQKRLDFFEDGFTPIENWMNMPEIGFLIA
ncbi:hypothetical protein CTI12_AA021560 [Artemisia annua]|uniref:Uncharacterized protein n=1 Tax=Artemisia annua TaxID=35608 RepID=A0A2U1QJZ3_ARTAN|nr:hypothetical protein CTI12_AA021560 [Artemisia annua]